MEKQQIKMQKEIINSYKNVCDTSDELIEAQKLRIEQLEDEIKIHKEAVEKLFKMFDEAIEIAKKQITNLPTITLN